MAISIPIISEFNGAGIDKAVKQFKQLETTGQKAQFALKKAAIPAAAAFAGLTAVLGDSIKAATEDAEAQALLARQLRASALASDATIRATEDFISKTSMAAAVADDQLRPALAKLVTATGEVSYSQDLLNVALDVSAATGKDLTTVSDALAKGYAGNTKALGALSPELKAAIKDGAEFSDVLQILDMNFKGAAETAANTAAGGMRRLSISIGEAKESLGAAFLPVLEAALPKLQAFANWAMENPELLRNVALGIGGITVATLALNAAMAANPYVLIASGIVALAIAFERLGTAYRSATGAVKFLLGIANVGAGIAMPGFLGRAIDNLFGGGGGAGSVPRGGRLAIPAMANGGIVTGPTLALIGEAGPEAVVPLDRAGGMGGVTINVNGGDPEAVVNALRRYMNRYGNIPIRTVAP
jgi:hypothetical protein